MGLKSLFFLIAAFSITSLAIAQDTITTPQKDSLAPIVYDIENDYIHIYKNRITAKLYYVNTSNSLRLSDRNSDLSFNLEPNKQNRIGGSVAFRSINLSYAFAPDFLAKNKDNEDSRLFNLNFRTYFGKHWMQTLDFYNQKGFYINQENTNVNVYMPDTKSLKIGGATSYIFNENFSFRAIASQDEKQIKSAGSFIPSIVYYYTYYHIRFDNEGLVDPIDSKSKSFDIAFAPSYYYNFVPTKNLFLSAGFSAGIGLNYSEDSTEKEHLTSLLTELDFRGSATYDLDNLYLGVHYNYLILNHNSDRSTYVNDNIPYFQIFLGYRFKAPKKVVRKADDFNNKLNL